LPQATSLFNDSKRNGETDISLQAILANQRHADSPSEPRERVHIVGETFSVGDQQYYINANIVNVERYTDRWM